MTQRDVQRQRVNIVQASELAGVSRRAIYYWIESGKVEYVRTAGGSIRIYVDTLLRGPKAERDANLRRAVCERS